MTGQQKFFAVVVGDLAHLDNHEDPTALADQLKRGLAEISALPSIFSPYTITGNGKFQAVFHSGEHLFRSLLAIRALLYPVKCRLDRSIEYND